MKHQVPRMVNWLARLRTAALVLGLCTSCLLGSAEQLAAQDRDSPGGPEDVSFRTRDQKNLAGTYYASTLGKEAPVVVLLHMKGSNRLVWRGLAPKLQQQGFAVITVDLRGHGQSKEGSGAKKKKKSTKKKSTRKSKKRRENVALRPQDYRAMVFLDLEAVKKFIYEQHQEQKLNMRKMGIVAAGMSSAVAVNFAANDWNKDPHSDGVGASRTPRGQDVRALVLLSPRTAGPMTFPKSLKFLQSPAMKVAFLFMIGSGDKSDKGQTKKLFDQVSRFERNQDRCGYVSLKTAKRGTDLLSRRLSTEKRIGEFLVEHVKDRDDVGSAWRDRQSKLGKRK